LTQRLLKPKRSFGTRVQAQRVLQVTTCVGDTPERRIGSGEPEMGGREIGLRRNRSSEEPLRQLRRPQLHGHFAERYRALAAFLAHHLDVPQNVDGAIPISYGAEGANEIVACEIRVEPRIERAPKMGDGLLGTAGIEERCVISLDPDPYFTAKTQMTPPSGTSGKFPGDTALMRDCIERASCPQPETTAMYCLPSTMNDDGGA